MKLAVLLIFAFQTGDSTCSFWNENIILSADQTNLDSMVDSIEDSLSSFLDSGEDFDYGFAVESVMKQSGFQWERFIFNNKTPIDTYRIIYI